MIVYTFRNWPRQRSC